MDKNIYLALRFHTNFYHSYRGDTPDEKGFGKDIRIISRILSDLDRLNEEGVPVRGTWDIENYYSLENLMPQFCPELLTRLQQRVKEGKDVVAPMSWNNGIVSVSTQEEFDQITRWTISNPKGSGLADLFDSWEPVLRPQECMFTPSFLRRYPEQGIRAVSLYYSAHPFNGFSNFMAPLSFEQRYNPIRIVSRDLPGEMIMIPAYNNGDVADHWLSLRGWIKSMRKKQLAGNRTEDLLLLIDMDGDDEFWSGMEIPLFSHLFPSFNGLYSMIKSLSDLDYLRFTTAGDYLGSHQPLGSIELNQDTADGSWDGMSSWAEKWSNTRIWSQLNESRRLDLFSEALGGEEENKKEARFFRIKSLTTTHFGLSSPIMNRSRLQIAQNLAMKTVELSRRALDRVLSERKALDNLSLILTPGVDYKKASGLVRFKSVKSGNISIALDPRELTLHKQVSLIRTGEDESGFLLNMPLGDKPCIKEGEIGNGLISLKTSETGNSLIQMGDSYLCCLGSSVTYKGKVPGSSHLKREQTMLSEDLVRLSIQGEIVLARGKTVLWKQSFLIARGIPRVYVDVLVEYPETEPWGYNKKRAENLESTWDARWTEVKPCELIPRLQNGKGESLRVWKHNFFNEVSSYDLNYHLFSKNKNLSSFNNHITNGWVAVTSGKKGVLVAQSGLYDNNFAFCPMRLRQNRGIQRLSMNPLGTYFGKQMSYQTSHSGLGKILSLGLSDHLDSYAPSYNGKKTRFSLMIAPYEGDCPGEEEQTHAMLFAVPPLLTD